MWGTMRDFTLLDVCGFGWFAMAWIGYTFTLGPAAANIEPFPP
jgi:hypothetical protein